MKHGMKKKCSVVLAGLLIGAVSVNAGGSVYAGKAQEETAIVENVPGGPAEVAGKMAQPEKTTECLTETGRRGAETERPAEASQEEASEAEEKEPQTETAPEAEKKEPQAETAPEAEKKEPQAEKFPKRTEDSQAAMAESDTGSEMAVVRAGVAVVFGEVLDKKSGEREVLRFSACDGMSLLGTLFF